jgi:hypothetical protein
MIKLCDAGTVSFASGSLASGSTVVPVTGGLLEEIDFLPGPTSLGKIWVIEAASVLVEYLSQQQLLIPACGLFIVKANQNVIREVTPIGVTSGADFQDRGLRLDCSIRSTPDVGLPLVNFQYGSITLRQKVTMGYGYILRAVLLQQDGSVVPATQFFAQMTYRELIDPCIS